MDNIPTAIKAADVQLWKCAIKATQLHAVKPIMAYWCYYWVVNQILARQMHAADDEVLNYTTTLMDTLEHIKSDHASEEAITDDVAGQAYVESFAQDTLDRAERVVRANKVTHQTATTFDAAATFFQLVHVWGPPDAETQQKIKYAKWNAARIARALREGRDPNESNPRHDDEHSSAGIVSPASPTAGGGMASPPPPQARFEDAPDTKLALPGVSMKLNMPAAPRSQPDYYDSTNNTISSPESPQTQEPTPSFSPPSNLPSAPQTLAPIPEPPSKPSMAWPPPPPSARSPELRPLVPPPLVSVPARIFPPQALAFTGGNLDEVAVVDAQKHAKWAISALNFEDVPTAVRELRKALELLGVT